MIYKISHLQCTTETKGPVRDIPEYIHECTGVCYTVISYNANTRKVIRLCSCKYLRYTVTFGFNCFRIFIFKSLFINCLLKYANKIIYL